MIIGLTGTLGAGKGTVVEYLVKEQGFVHFSARALITEEVRKRGLPLNRDSMVAVANEWREKHGPDCIAVTLFERAKDESSSCVIESLRTVGEIEALRKKGNFFLFAIDADAAVRYNRVIDRASETDSVSFEEFVANEQREMTSTDPAKQNLSACIALADFVINNDRTVADLEKKVNSILAGISQEKILWQ